MFIRSKSRKVLLFPPSKGGLLLSWVKELSTDEFSSWRVFKFLFLPETLEFGVEGGSGVLSFELIGGVCPDTKSIKDFISD